MLINTIILTLMGICFVLGAVDRLLGNRFGLGEKFEDGIRTSGDLMLSMAGIVILAPLLSEYLLPVLEPMFSLFGADPAMFAGMFLANDMGGAELASRLTQDADIFRFSGLIVASMLGATVVFTIPSAMKLIPKQYHNILFLGISFGLIPIPVGALIGGLAAGLPVIVMLRNLIPILIFIVILTVGIVRFETLTLRLFNIFGHFISIVIMIGLFLGFLQSVTGKTVI